MESDLTKVHRAPHKQVYDPAVARRIPHPTSPIPPGAPLQGAARLRQTTSRCPALVDPVPTIERPDRRLPAPLPGGPEGCPGLRTRRGVKEFPGFHICWSKPQIQREPDLVQLKRLRLAPVDPAKLAVFCSIDPAIQFLIIAPRRIDLHAPLDAEPGLQRRNCRGLRLKPIAPVIAPAIRLHLPPVGVKDERSGRRPRAAPATDGFEGGSKEFIAIGRLAGAFERALARVGHEPAPTVSMKSVVAPVAHVMPHVDLVAGRSQFLVE